ncbi:MAG: hypothetical protein QF738_04075 [Rhodospirillales bacterium]|nr:hypothetical protein [Rhodospirillales bacterium]
MHDSSFKLVVVVSAASAAACVALMAVRVVSAVSFHEPLHLITSGWEQESLFAIWKSLQGLAVYADPYEIPFAASVYNWLFYQSFAGVTGSALGLLTLEDAWIPTIARLFTLAGAVAGSAICYRSFVAVVGSADRPLKALSAAFAVFVFFGPLIGFWAITARPDVWALALEILGVLLFWRFHRSRSVPALLAAALALYAAWAFKQANVLIAVSIALFLLTRRDWKGFGLFAAALGAGWGLTLAAGPPDYAAALLEATRKGFSLAQMTRNLANFSVKSVPSLAAFAGLLGALLVSPRLKQAFHEDDRWAFAVVGVGATAVLTVAASAKIGASEVYYLPLSYLLALGVLVGTAILRAEAAGTQRTRVLPAVLWTSAFGWGANLAAVATVFLGFQGVLSVTPQHARNLEVRRCVEALPKPVFVDNLYLSLPWMNVGGPHFVVSYNYETDRRADFAFERGGIGGMIEHGDFAALVLRRGDATFDGGRLDRYERRPGPCGHFVAYRRR